MKYLVICTVTNRSDNALAFDTRAEAVGYVSRVINTLGYDVDPGESRDGMWFLSEAGVRVKFVLKHVEAAHIHYWLRRVEQGRHIETRRFKTRHTALHYAQNTLYDSGKTGLEFALRLVLESTRRNKDDCKVLGVTEDADDAVIKAAYRAKLKTAHPDVGGSDEDVKKLTAAYERLTKAGASSMQREEYVSMEEGELTKYLQAALHGAQKQRTTYSTQNASTHQQARTQTPAVAKKNDGILDKLPDWLRWVLAWPAGIIGSLIAGYLVRFVWGLTSSDDTNALLDLAQAGVIGFFWVYIPTLFAPKAKKVIAVISLCLLIGILFMFLGLAVYSALMGYEMESPGLFYVGIAVYIIGAVIAVVNTPSTDEQS